MASHILSFISFFRKKLYFPRKRFLEAKSLLMGRGRLATKMNITFFMRNEVLNIFSSNKFFEKKQNFWRKGGKNFWGAWPLFKGKGHLTLKMNITFFNRKLDAK